MIWEKKMHENHSVSHGPASSTYALGAVVRCPKKERLNSFTRALPGRPSDRKHNRGSCFSCSFHGRPFVCFAFTEDVQRPAVPLSFRIRRASWDAAAVAFPYSAWSFGGEFLASNLLLCLRQVNKPSAAELDPMPLPVRERKA